MKINCYIALVAAALACACNPLADTDDMDNNVQATRIAFSPEVVTLDNAGRNAEEDQGQNVIVTLNPKARRSMAWSAETDKTETWCTLTECSVTDADGVTHRGFRITATENTAYKRTATVTPVSYTHLDVYKRQDLHRVALVPVDPVYDLFVHIGEHHMVARLFQHGADESASDVARSELNSFFHSIYD